MSRSLLESRGRVVLLNLWATRCVPGRAEMPALERRQARFGGPQFELVALSIGLDGLSKVKDFCREPGLKALGIYVDTSGNAMAK